MSEEQPESVGVNIETNADQGIVMDEDYFKSVEVLLRPSRPADKEIDERFWALNSNDIALSKFNDSETRQVLGMMELLFLSDFMTKPDYEDLYEDERKKANIRIAAFSRIHRAKEGFERTALISQIKEIKTGQQKQAKPGLVSRIFGGGD